MPPLRTALRPSGSSILWEQLHERLPLTGNETTFETSHADYWLLKTAREASCISEMAARLKSFGAENGWPADVAFDLQLAATNSSRQKPEAEMTHLLERVILPYNDS